MLAHLLQEVKSRLKKSRAAAAVKAKSKVVYGVGTPLPMRAPVICWIWCIYSEYLDNILVSIRMAV